MSERYQFATGQDENTEERLHEQAKALTDAALAGRFDVTPETYLQEYEKVLAGLRLQIKQ